jgi:hypothetical protein
MKMARVGGVEPLASKEPGMNVGGRKERHPEISKKITSVFSNPVSADELSCLHSS